MDLESFITNVANKIKFTLNDFQALTQMLHTNDTTIQLLAVVGMRKLLSIENNPPIQAVIDANLVTVFIAMMHHDIPKF